MTRWCWYVYLLLFLTCVCVHAFAFRIPPSLLVRYYLCLPMLSPFSPPSLSSSSSSCSPSSQELLQQQADVMAKDDNGLTPLHRAAYWYAGREGGGEGGSE